ncbi:phosphatidylethanolamine-binding protein [Loa loa]|uniref:Large ribosomal subunit protein mL38 n=1 Tax=Loa loa TaxID=7209 RepID=A0A1I7VYA9_LOALO|nr:phosphatidylethanolamine-binding protein [Loa loa]EFO20240.1 phosphatidylethanolamine-binding protein [Loa loa]
MKRALRSIYADIYVKDAHRVRGTPRVARPWRPKVIAWAGPAAFYRNRFYEPNAWYKARITKPVLYPKMYVIDPDNHLLSLKERLAVPETQRYDIGFKKKSSISIPSQLWEPENVLKSSKKMQLTINLKAVEHWQLSIFHHYRIFDDLFHSNIFFHNTQNMQLKWGSIGLYQGNLIDAADTSKKPEISIESLDGGFSSFILLNLDGNPYDCSGEVVHWLVANIPDGKSVTDGTEIVPYLQVMPFKGTGYHRIACLLLRHNEVINLASKKPKSVTLMSRIFNVGRLYKEFEKQWTPSALSFAQASWDVSVNETLHRIGMKSPIYEYQYNPPVKVSQKEFPLKPQPFNLYLDQFRNPKEVHADLLKRRLQMRRIDKNPEQPKYPDIDYVEHKKNMPFWQHDNLMRKNSGSGRYKALWSNPIS